MKWDVDMEEIEAVLEKIWDLHDKLSDAIHTISRTHFLNSIKTLKKSSSEELFFSRQDKKKPLRNESAGDNEDEHNGGFVFVKEMLRVDDGAAMAEARSLNAIRTALENLEDQLEFFHTVQSQQRAERDAAIARLEQSRIVLAMRLADHHGKKYKVIEEALAFVGDVQDASRFVAPENLFEIHRSHSAENMEDHEPKKSNFFIQVLISSFNFAKKSLKMERMGGVIGNAAFIAVGMIALLQLHQVAFKSDFVLDVPQTQEGSCYKKRNEKIINQLDGSSQSSRVKHLDVLSARG
ncbi:plastid division protein PDV1-like [Tasmannia lanceolata]|uniref:plastid division protein PDV1-like n=1 Tax=Tasmannia lanceolata TaxID=3420 RepID=UPI0040632254